MTTDNLPVIIITGYRFDNKTRKWKFEESRLKIDDYEKGKEYVKNYKNTNKHYSLLSIAVSMYDTETISKKEINKNKVFSLRKRGERKYRSNEETLGSLKTYIIYKSH